MKKRIFNIRLRLRAPVETLSTEVLDYVRESVSSMGGGGSPESPFFRLGRGDVTATSLRVAPKGKPLPVEPYGAGWLTGNPPDHGYYLATWKSRSGHVQVSELWFNPQATPKWWAGRGYMWEPSGRDLIKGGAIDTVLAWRHLPLPYTG